MKILVHALDSDEGRAAARRAIEEATLRGAELVLASYVRIDADGGSPQRSSAAATARLEELAQEASEAGVSEVITRVLPGVSGAAQELLDLVDTMGADLLVIGLRRRSRVGKLVLGSVSQELLLGSSAAVLAVKAEEH